MAAAASAAPSFTALGPALGPALAARSAATSAWTVLAGIVGTRSASVRMTPELLATPEPAASPRSDLGLI